MKSELSKVRDRAQGLAIASIIIVLAAYLLFLEGLTVRQLIALLIIAPSIVMLMYNLFFPDPDRLYGLGLYSFLIIISIIIYGVSTRIAGGLFLLIVAVLLIVWVFSGRNTEGPRQTPREPERTASPP